jgi:hypothetical protein
MVEDEERSCGLLFSTILTRRSDQPAATNNRQRPNINPTQYGFHSTFYGRKITRYSSLMPGQYLNMLMAHHSNRIIHFSSSNLRRSRGPRRPISVKFLSYFICLVICVLPRAAQRLGLPLRGNVSGRGRRRGGHPWALANTRIPLNLKRYMNTGATRRYLNGTLKHNIHAQNVTLDSSNHITRITVVRGLSCLNGCNSG